MRTLKTSLITGLGIALTGAITLLAQDTETQREPVRITKDRTELDREGSDVVVSYAPILDEVTPAVVAITVERRLVQRSRRSREEMMEELMRRFWGLPPREDRQPEREERGEEREERFVPEGMGSGFIVSSDGYVLTNNHVVQGRRGFGSDEEFDVKRINVQLKDGREFEAEVVGTDPSTDLAVLKIEAEDLPTVALGDSENSRVGDVVFAIGNPLSVGLTVSQGIISALNRTDLGIIDRGLMQQGANFEELPPIENFIQTDAAVNMGNSGGPLVDAKGRVIGINSAISSITGGSIGIGFAIPVNLAEDVMQSIVTGGEVRRGFIGVGLEALTPEKARGFGLDRAKGALVKSVQEGLPGDRAGLKRGDIILSVNGETVDSVRDLVYLISRENPGTTVSLEVFRYGERMDVDVTLGDRQSLVSGEMPSRDEPGGRDSDEVRSDELVPGIRVRPVNSRVRMERGLPEDTEGLVVSSVDESAGNFETTLNDGMVILEINGRPVADIESGRKALKKDNNAIFALDEQGRESFHWLLFKK